MNAALSEIERLEQSYLELFLGKQTVLVETHRYLVYPEAGKNQYVFCRFSPAAGLLPDSDLSGDMVLLQIEPAGEASCSIEAGPKESSVVKCRVAAPGRLHGDRRRPRVCPCGASGLRIRTYGPGGPSAPQVIPPR